MNPLAVLGFAGSYVDINCTPSHYATKVGGIPWLPGKLPPHDFSSVTCRICNAKLALVVQGYAPLTATEHGMDVPERVLLLYGCIEEGCGSKPGSWRAFSCFMPQTDVQAHTGILERSPCPSKPIVLPGSSSHECQLCQQAGYDSRVNEFGADVKESSKLKQNQDLSNKAAELSHTPGEGAAAKSSCADVFGFDGGSNDDDILVAFGSEDLRCAAACTTSGALEGRNTTGSTSAFDFRDLDAALESVAAASKEKDATLASQSRKHVSQDHGSSMNESVNPVESGLPTWVPSGEFLTNLPVLPEFYLYAEKEPVGDADSTPVLTHVRDLLRRYERDEQELGGTPNINRYEGSSHIDGRQSVQDQQGPTPRMTGREGLEEECASEEEGDCDAESGVSSAAWAGEEYEEEKVAGLQDSYLKFAARLRRSPEQCVRYCRGGQLLWPHVQLLEEQPCQRCRAASVFEMQVMTPLISLLIEAASATIEQSDFKSSIQQEVNVSDQSEATATTLYTDVDGSTHSLGREVLRHDEVGSSSSPCSPDWISMYRRAANGAANWDWCTIAVKACSRCCQKAHDVRGSTCQQQQISTAAADIELMRPCWVEEQVYIADENSCHAHKNLK
ncbi:hypothetical protein CEUSTIGMA_g4653.t1 [Chlamydomonas eustigma]|uniref:Programmed cell death protein 2 C-terminal domain-containing protein n=1 Tax=Chlamydomonas eustigma TaxID=1157962 RepID=A0A250X2A4_9CHLO|nr:hypothetical protein CEUSTIGMA_g4653.t1 [Chlamydomonas eustigma]|eukprot:GAX77207.1 hypothetical protein CEUSTIGMA_g4653.t1 [Chlamydomonas eustigma]